MSLPRTLSPLLSSTRRSLTTALQAKSRYRPSSHALLPPICPSCIRRSLQTATPYRPETLDIPGIDPAPPRNKDAPLSELTRRSVDQKPPFTTSTVEAGKKIETRQPEPIPTPSSVLGKAPNLQPSQASSPTTQSITTASISNSTSTTATPAPRKLRPRKAAMTLTPLAVKHIRSLTEQTPPKLIRVGVKNKGCSGLSYNLEYIQKPGRFDETVEQEGVRVFIDSKALFSIIGSEMDWVEDKLSARFVFKNPNIKEECGCGESFMVHSQGS